METPFKSLAVSPDDVLTEDLMHAFQQNNQWLMENTPRGRFYFDETGGKSTETRLAIIWGSFKVSKSKKNAFAGRSIKFPKDLFHDKCKPNVTTGVIANDNEIFCVLNGLGTSLLPSSEGFEVRVYAPSMKKGKWKISKEFYVHWQAIGYRKDDINEF